jgi:hypothetical protein
MKSHGCSHLGQEGFCWNLWQQWTMNSCLLYLNTEIWIFAFIKFILEEKCWKCSFPWQCLAHKHATIENIIKVAYTVFTHSVYCPHLTLWNVHLMGPFKYYLQGHHYMDDESLQTACASGYREMGATLPSRIRSACYYSKVKKDCWQRWRLEKWSCPW